MEDLPEAIFNFIRSDWKYKGIFFAELDNEEILTQPEMAVLAAFERPGKSYIVGVMACIWVDEKDIWHCKARLKFPSGNKQSWGFHDDEPGCNETKMLTYLYRLPMINKRWYPNKKETIFGMLEIMQKSDMIESQVITFSGKGDAEAIP